MHEALYTQLLEPLIQQYVGRAKKELELIVSRAYAQGTNAERQNLIFRRLAAVLQIENLVLKDRCLSYLAEEYNKEFNLRSSTLNIELIVFLPQFRQKLLEAGMEQELVDELFPAPRIKQTVKLAMLGR